MTPTRTRYLSAAETAKLVRQALKDAHPGVKFSVRSRNYAGGASVRVNWTDGPTCREVETTTRRYKGADFDGMTDTRSYHDALLSTEDGAEVVHFGAGFISCQRTISDEYRARLEKEIEDFTGEPYNPSEAYHAAAASNTLDGPRGLSHDRLGTTWGSDLLDRLAYSRPVPVEAKTSTQPRHVTAADTAVLLRKSLKAAHPKVIFTVRSQRYAGGASIDVGWTDGPTVAQVQQTTELYRGATGGGAAGPRQYRDTLLPAGDGGELVHLATHDVSSHRKLSLEFRAELEAEIADTTGEPFNENKPYRVATLDPDGTDAPTTAYYVDESAPTYGADLIARLAKDRPR
jgi:hypothetical protein